MIQKSIQVIFVSACFVLAYAYSSPVLAAKPSCPGHPSCGDGGGEEGGDIFLGPGNDTWPGSGDDNTGDDVVFGQDGDDLIYGGFGDDRIDGGAGDDEIHGDEGSDDLRAGDGLDYLYGGSGDDWIRIGVSGSFDANNDEKGDYVDGGDDIDRLLFNSISNLEELDVVFPTLDGAPGTYAAHYRAGKGKKSSLVTILGEFDNIEDMFAGQPTRVSIIGNDLGNELGGGVISGDGNYTIEGKGGNDSLQGSYGADGDELDGGEGEDSLTGYGGDDVFIGGIGESDTVWTREGHGDDTMEDFEVGLDRIIIYNSNTCFDDLRFSVVNADGGSSPDDLLIEFGSKNSTASITLWNVSAVSPGDFRFDVDNSGYQGCP